MNYTKILEEIRQEVTHFFRDHEKPGIVYHNLSHTLNVVKHTTDIAMHYQLGERDFFIVVSAAWFHDTGYLVQDGSDHERKGADKAGGFLSGREVDELTITAVRGCILATTIPQTPHDLLE